MRNQSFNFDEALKQLQSGKNLLGTDGILTPLIKQLTEAALQAEIEHYLSTTSIDTRKNGYTRKTVKSTYIARRLNFDYKVCYELYN